MGNNEVRDAQAVGRCATTRHVSNALQYATLQAGTGNATECSKPSSDERSSKQQAASIAKAPGHTTGRSKRITTQPPQAGCCAKRVIER